VAVPADFGPNRPYSPDGREHISRKFRKQFGLVAGGTAMNSKSEGAGRLSAAAIEALASRLRGACVAPGDAGYDAVRRIWNGLADKRPAIIVQCAGAADVIDAVAFARVHDLTIAVRGGGHNVAGNATCDDGIVIDLSHMRSVRVDPATRRAHVSGGATIADVDHETQAFGLAVPLGIVSETGIGGLTLCGGLGWLRRQHGLSCDSLVSVDVVTADGKFLTASETENSDLFWGLHGGGGNFGIVTSFEFKLHPVGPTVSLCAPIYALENSSGIIRKWRDYLASAPDELSPEVSIWSIPPAPPFPPEIHGRQVAILAAVHTGSLEEGARYIQPLRELGSPLYDLSGPIPFIAVQKAFDPFFRKGERLNYWKSLYLETLSDEAIEQIVARGLERPSPWSLIVIWQLGGALARRAPEVSPLRMGAPYLLSIDSSWTDPDQTDASIAWTRSFWSQMRKFSDGAVYLNFAGYGEEGQAMLRTSYGNENYQRLKALKTKYDPKNLFHLNQNIEPSAL
jgi:FAD/FMN-containing dehydrogenase